MVTVCNLPACSCAITDADAHSAGPEAIITRLGNRVLHSTHRITSPSTFLNAVPEFVAQFADCGLVLYQAGTDQYIDDPLGAGTLTSEQMTLRDRIVFSGLRDIGVPFAWNLAGSYQRGRALLDIHDATMIECARAWL